MLDYKQLKELLWACHERFRYVGDMAKYDIPEYWPSFNDIPDVGIYEEDCDGFAQMVRKELHKLGEESRLALCGVNSDNINHCVAIYDNYVLDNIHHFPMRKSELATYKWFTISGFTVDEPWREII